MSKKQIRRHFNQAAQTYEATAVVQAEVARRLAERFELFTDQPEKILDLGAGTGYLTQAALKHYPKAQVFALDLSEKLLAQQKIKKALFKRQRHFLVCADAENLPFPKATFDWVISNGMFQWTDMDQAFAEVRRVIKPEGVLLFSYFGPDTFKELRLAWALVDDQPHVNEFVDMHNVGDGLINSGFARPVMDQEIIRLTYESPLALLKDIQHMGTNTLLKPGHKGLMGKNKWRAFLQALEKFRLPDGRYPLSFEVVYGQAWASKEIIKGPDRDKSGIHQITLDEFNLMIKKDDTNA